MQAMEAFMAHLWYLLKVARNINDISHNDFLQYKEIKEIKSQVPSFKGDKIDTSELKNYVGD